MAEVPPARPWGAPLQVRWCLGKRLDSELIPQGRNANPSPAPPQAQALGAVSTCFLGLLPFPSELVKVNQEVHGPGFAQSAGQMGFVSHLTFKRGCWWVVGQSRRLPHPLPGSGRGEFSVAGRARQGRPLTEKGLSLRVALSCLAAGAAPAENSGFVPWMMGAIPQRQ